MAARDIFHNAVKAALQKEGWTITHDPLPMPYGGVDLYIDLGAERMLAAERRGERIAVEIKSFLSLSPVSEFHTALGQFLNYRLVLESQDPDASSFWRFQLIPTIPSLLSHFHSSPSSATRSS